jgi:iron complex outermembrane receptor protein
MNRSTRLAIEIPNLLLLSLVHTVAAAQTTVPPEDVSFAYGSSELISLATGYERPLFDAPVSATIVTRAEMERAGAQSLADVLQAAGGYYVGTDDGRSHHITVRGVTSRVLILVNGIPLHQGFLNATESVHDILLYDVERIEVTRSPGSAVYGADAVSGIVNLITRTASESMPTEFGVTGGTQDSAGAWLLHGARLGDVDVRFYGALFKTDFMDEQVLADAQSKFDRLLGTQASLAPGQLNTARKVLETRIEVARGFWTMRASHRSEYDFGTGSGLAYALDPAGHYDTRLSTLELVHDRKLSETWSLSGYIAYMLVQHDASVTLYPAGAFGGAFPDGMRQDYTGEERRLRGEVNATYGGIAAHKLLFGVGGLYSTYDTTNDTRNYTIDRGAPLPTPTFAPGGGIGLAELIGDTERGVHYLFAHDEWSPLQDWTFTGGVRWDRYSDFGSTTNPRAAIVWSPSARTTAKLLYGRAFRPPSLVELESNGTYAPLGNRALKPSTIEMTEVSVAHRNVKYEASIGAFRYRQQNLVETTRNPISPTGAQYVNGPPDTGGGAELYLRYQFVPSLALNSNYTYQLHKARANNVNAYQAPRHQVYLQLTFTPHPDWSASLGAMGILDRRRDPTDARAPPNDYTLVNVSFQRKNLPAGLQFSLTATNLFDETYSYPSDSPSLLPFDLPARGREVIVRVIKLF